LLNCNGSIALAADHQGSARDGDMIALVLIEWDQQFALYPWSPGMSHIIHHAHNGEPGILIAGQISGLAQPDALANRILIVQPVMDK
jgi:hypothetical protein